MTNPVVVTDALFGLSKRRRGQFFALDADTGATPVARTAASGREHRHRQDGAIPGCDGGYAST